MRLCLELFAHLWRFYSKNNMQRLSVADNNGMKMDDGAVPAKCADLCCINTKSLNRTSASMNLETAWLKLNIHIFNKGRIYSRQTDNEQAANLYFAGAAPGSIDIMLLVRVEQTKYVCAPRLHIKT